MDRKPGESNWIDKAGGLPSYIERIARHLSSERGMTVSHAIAAAIEVCRKWSADPKVSSATRAQATAALAQWEAMKAKARATKD